MSTSDGGVQSPSLVKEPIPYRLFSSSKSFPPFADGGLFRGDRLAWLLSRDGRLRVFKSLDGECVSDVRLVPSGCSIAANCSCEIESETRSKAALLALAVHPEGSRGKTTVVVVDAATSKILRTVKIPWDVSSLCGVSGSCLQAARGLFSPTTLHHFSGILAVGCAGGRVLLVDLSLGVEFTAEASVAQPQDLVFVENGAGSAVVSCIRDRGKYACIDILDSKPKLPNSPTLIAASFQKKGQFEYHCTTLPVIHKFQTESLAITSLHFVPQILSLLIGFSIGGFQLYDVQKMAVIHAGTCPKVPSPVTHFAYQEPENDPKNNVYLWVARGNPASTSLKVETKLALYQLSFTHKVCNSAGTTYQNFSNCGLVFLYPLTPTPTRPLPTRSLSSTLLSCRTVEMKRGGRGLDESHDESAHGPDLTIAVFIWGCGDPAHKEYLVGVFDLNQYYHSQVPKQLFWKTTGKHTGVLGCSYFAFYSLQSMVGDSALLDAAVGSVAPFVSLPPVPEIHLWPSSLSFYVTAMTSDAFLKCSCLGLQRLTLEELNVGGVAMLSCPQGIFRKCERAELFGSTWDLDHSSVAEQQKTLLSVALEHKLTYLLKSCAHTWIEGGSETFGVFVEWLQGKLDECKSEKNRLCLPLFSGTADSVDKSLLLLLNHLQLKLYHLSRVLTSLLLPLTSSPLSSDDPLLTDLAGFYVSAATSHTVTKVVIWCVRNGLLPISTVRRGRYFHYPASALTALCNRLRSKINPCKLSVDHLCEELQADYHYPATSLEGLLAIFTSANSQAQHTIMMYFLCDISNLKDLSFHQDTLLNSYSAEFHLPKQFTALAKGLWALDHMQYQVALRNLIGRQLGALQWFPWQHEVVVSLLLKAADTTLAASYIDANRNFVNDLKLQLKVYLGRECVWQAIRLLRPYEDSTEIEELFGHFLDLCFEHKCLRKLVNLPLNEFEDATFCCYLERSQCFTAQELLIMHYTEHYRYNDAISLQEKIRPIAMADPDPRVRERSQFRDHLLQGISSCLPTVVKELGKSSRDTPAPSRLKPKTKAKNPPLSSVLAKHETKNKVTSSVEFIYQEMKKIDESRHTRADPVSPFRKKKFECAAEHTPFFSPPPSVRKAMWSRSNLSVVRATPAVQLQESPSRVSMPDHHTSSTVSGLSSFRTHMEKFKERMFQLSQTSIDPACITTPAAAKPMTSSRPMPLPPPSILKVREQQQEEEGDREEEGQQATPATLTRRIRFAEETASPAPSPQLSGKSAYISSPTAAASAEIPLPSSDDSDLFYSFTDSPTSPIPPPPPPPPRITQLTPAHPPQGTPSQSPLPKTQLFVGADDDYCGDEDEDGIGQQQGGDDKQDLEMQVEVQASDQSDQSQKSHDQTSTLATGEEPEVVTKVTGTPQKVKFHSLLTREGIGFHSKKLSGTNFGSGSKTTPTGGIGVGPFAPRHPSPLSYSSISSQDSPSAKRRNIFLLVAASELTKPATTTTSLSSVMVPVMASSSVEGEKMGAFIGVRSSGSTKKMGGRTADVGASTFRFSPGTIVSSPPVEKLRDDPSPPTFAFSPPLTRSAARRRALRTAVEETPFSERKGETKKSTTRSMSPPDQAPKSTPQQSREQSGAKKGQRRDIHIAVRKSSRLLQARKDSKF